MNGSSDIKLPFFTIYSTHLLIKSTGGISVIMGK